MDKSELGIIQELMEFLQDKMQYGHDDLGDRLGRPKPEMAIMKVEGSMPGDDAMGDKMPTDDDQSPPMGMDPDKDDDMNEDPDDSLKRRLMQMRG